MIVKQAENVVLLLQFFAARQKPATLAEVSQHFGWPRSSTYNLLSTLASHGFLYETRERRGFYPTPLWLDLATTISEADPLPDKLTRIADRLATESGETVWLSLASGMFRLSVYVQESRQQVRVSARVGDRIPIHAAASGHALMSQMSPAEVEQILRKADYRAYAENTPTSREAVLQQIEEGRQRGWFLSAANYSNGLGGVAAPVIENGRCMAITIAGPVFRIDNELPRFAAMIHEALAHEYGPEHSQETLRDMRLPGSKRRHS